MHVVQAEGAAVALLKGVGVMPQAVGTAQLSVNKAVGRLPFGDFRSPADGNAMHPNLIVDQGPRPHFDGAGRQHGEFHPRRSDGLEISRVGKEGEHLVPRARQPKFGLQGVFFH